MELHFLKRSFYVEDNVVSTGEKSLRISQIFSLEYSKNPLKCQILNIITSYYTVTKL